MAIYIQLVKIEAAIKNLKDDLALRSIFHHLEHRIQAHIFVAFMAWQTRSFRSSECKYPSQLPGTALAANFVRSKPIFRPNRFQAALKAS